jgi:hypothetical protein
MSRKEYFLKYECNSIWPRCACGCNEKVKWKNTHFSKYLYNHSNKTGTESHNLRSLTKKKRFSNGEISAWNKGLTKETDKRVSDFSKRITGLKKGPMSESGKRIRRIGMLNHLKQYYFRPIGIKEIELLSKQELIDNCKIFKQFDTGIGYIVDGYCLETNTVYEVYEKRHRDSVEKDNKRQQEIQSYLNCKFIVLWT